MPPRGAPAPAPAEWAAAFAYLRRRGVARVRWISAVPPGEDLAHIDALALEGPAGEPLPPALLCRGFSLLHRHGDAAAPAGGTFVADLATGAVSGPRPRSARASRT